MMRIVPLVIAAALLGQVAPVDRPAGANAVVAADGSGDYNTVHAAIDAAPQDTRASAPWVIFVRTGTYRELVYVQREKRFVVLVGEDPARTVITYGLHSSMPGPDGKPIGTFRTPTVQIDADDFTAENLTFRNDSGPIGQALAIRVDGDRTTFRNCLFLGWQDTILLNRGRQYIEDSVIAGHVDFVFGGATAFFERCRVHCWRNGYISAASTPPDARYGFVFADGAITGETPDVQAYLGRPWRDFASVLFMRTAMSSIVRPEGWHNWDRPERERTARFAEYANTGRGAGRSSRVAWSKELSQDEAATTSISSVVGGPDGWNPLAVLSHPSAAKALDEAFSSPGPHD
jgi:pectinesterase